MLDAAADSLPARPLALAASWLATNKRDREKTGYAFNYGRGDDKAKPRVL